MSFPPITAEDLEALVAKLFPRGYVDPLQREREGMGFDVYAQAAAMLDRVAEAVGVSTQGYYLKHHSTQQSDPAGGAVQATVTGTLRRAAGSHAITVPAGTELVSAYRRPDGELVEGPSFALVADAVFPIGAVELTNVLVRAVRPGWQGNVLAGAITGFREVGRAFIETAEVSSSTFITQSGAGDTFTLAMVGRYVQPDPAATSWPLPPQQILAVQVPGATAEVTAPGFTDGAGQAFHVLDWGADFGFSFEHTLPATGGRLGQLDAIGDERLQGRKIGETDEAYRTRLCQLSDAISPAAIVRIATAILEPLGIRFALKETRDATSWVGFTLDTEDVISALDVDEGVFNAIIGGCEETRAFLICVSPSALGDFGMGLDEPDENPLGYPNALDVGGALDGQPLGFFAAVAALYDAVEAARAAGVCWQPVLDPSL